MYGVDSFSKNDGKSFDEIEADNNYSKFTKIGGRQPFDDEY